MIDIDAAFHLLSDKVWVVAEIQDPCLDQGIVLFPLEQGLRRDLIFSVHDLLHLGLRLLRTEFLAESGLDSTPFFFQEFGDLISVLICLDQLADVQLLGQTLYLVLDYTWRGSNRNLPHRFLAESLGKGNDELQRSLLQLVKRMAQVVQNSTHNLEYLKKWLLHQSFLVDQTGSGYQLVQEYHQRKQQGLDSLMLIGVDHNRVSIFGEVGRIHQKLQLRAKNLHASVIFFVPGFVLYLGHEAAEVVLEVKAVVLAKVLEEAAKHLINNVDGPPDRLLR